MCLVLTLVPNKFGVMFLISNLYLRYEIQEMNLSTEAGNIIHTLQSASVLFTK